MKSTRFTVYCSLLLLIVSGFAAPVHAQTNGMMTRRADIVEDKRVEQRMWNQAESNSIMNKRFPMEKWDTHFSSVGSKRAPIAMQEGKDKAIFKTHTIDRKEFATEMSRWNERMADLHKEAGIEMDERAQMVADRQLYSEMMQNAEQFSEMRETLSLREINRYQFRRNRSAGDIPVERAGSQR
jgi:hypothetical protein